MINEINNLEMFIKNAFNAKDNDTQSKPVFKISYDNYETIDNWGKDDDTKNIPDQLSFDVSVESSGIKENTFLKKDQEKARRLNVAMEGEFKTPMYSGNAKASVDTSNSSASHIEKNYSRYYSLYSIARFERIGLNKESLCLDFISKLIKLPLDISSKDSKDAYVKFFNEYGTHYVNKGVIGGLMIMETEINKSLLESFESTDIASEVGLAYDGLLSSGSLKTSMKLDTSGSKSLANESLIAKITARGGQFSANGSEVDWQNSIYDGPKLLYNVPNNDDPEIKLSKFESISELVSIADGNPKIKHNMDLLVEEYIYGEADVSAILRYSSELNFNEVYSDVDLKEGFVISTIRASKDGNRGSIQVMNDNKKFPDVIRAKASQHYYTGTDRVVKCASATIPKPSGTNLENQKELTSGTPNLSFRYVSFEGLKGKALLDWQEVEINPERGIITYQDGFLVAFIDWNNSNGARGYVEGVLFENEEWVVKCGSSQHYYTQGDIIVPNNSFCLPIKKYTQFYVSLTKTAGEPMAKAFFIPLSKDVLKLGEIQIGREETSRQAEEDGFLLVHLHAKKDGARGNADLYCSNKKPNELNKEDIKASTSVHYYTGSDCWVPQNSVMIPVPKGYSYKVVLYREDELTLPEIEVVWVPLKRVI